MKSPIAGSRALAMCLFVLCAAVSTAAEAQSDPAGAPIGDIVVTAQKRIQSANDVGLSIVGISHDTLREERIVSIEDLTRAVPGLTYALTPSGPPVLTLRGVGFYDSSLAAAPAVSVYVDEAPLALPIFSQVGVVDVARVEVLKGPQGTLYGENSTGGAINYIAAKPTDRFQAGSSLTYGSFSKIDAEGFVSGPLSSTLKIRLAGRTVQGGAWQKAYTRDDRLGTSRQSAARLIADWQPSDALHFTLNINGWIDRSDTQAVQLINVNCAVPSNCPVAGYPTAPKNARAADWTAGWPMRANDRFGQVTLRSEYRIADTVTLTSITGYQGFRQDKYLDQDGTNFKNLDFHQYGTARSLNEELRLAGRANRIDWVAGVYGAAMHVDDDGIANSSANSASDPLPGIIPPFPTSAVQTHQRVRNYAAFGSAEYYLTGRLSLVGGLRYSLSRRRFAGCEKSGPSPILGQFLAYLSASVRGTLPTIAPVPADGCVTLDATTFLQGETRDQLNEDNLSWRGGLNYKTAGGSLLYASLSKGYKSGSFPTVSASTSAQFAPVTQEALLAYELGIKAPLLDGALRIEAAAYYYDYRNKQVRGRTLDPIFGALEVLVNIPKSRVWGGEAAIRARPLDGFDLGASLTFTDSEVQRFSGVAQDGSIANYAGSPFPYAPRIQLVADARYEWGLRAGLRAFAGANLTHHSVSYASLGADPDLRLRPYVTLDLRVGVRSADRRWEVSAFGMNVTNSYYWNNMFQYTDTRIRIAARPATYGLSASWNY